ncbi:hypothetical protein IQ255_00060 [Pleurocapsales cyanobacterium LEGE 10410]|nr:hypothetical protein [Pleurocapsales cyanobacterium LEGE 10410]
MVNSKSKSLQAKANTLSICPGYESQQIYAVPTANNRTSCPSDSSKIVYVSTSGNDNNDGLSPNSPVKSLSYAVELTRRKSPDWIVLKRGEIFDDSFGVIKRHQHEKPLGGRNIEQPFVITSYGESRLRPTIRPQNNGIDLWGAFRNITISGLKFDSEPGSGGTGIRTLRGGTNYVIHNNYISGFGVGINLRGKAEVNQWFSKVLIKDNVIADSASSGKGHSQGIYAEDVKKLVIQGNVLDTCGWYIDRNGELEDSRIATMFNHCIYLQGKGYPARIRNNIITRASSHGLQARSGALVENNLFARNPIQFFISSKGLNGNANQRLMIARNNIVLEGNDINYSIPRGLGIQHNNAFFALYENNIVAHVLSLSKPNKKAIDIVCKTNDVHTSISGQCQARFRNNFVFNWGNELGGNLLSGRNFNNDLLTNHHFQNNTFIAVDRGVKFTSFEKETLKDRYTFRGNTYISNNLTNGKLFSLPGKYHANFTDWKKNVESRAKGLNYSSLIDPCRTMATYYDDFVLGNLQDNCQIMHDNELFERFIDKAKQKNSMINGSGIDLNSFNNYIREGFTLSPIRAD